MDTIQTIDKLKELLAPVAEKIGQTAEWGWDVIIRQQYVYAFEGLGEVILGIILAFAGYKLIKYGFKKLKEDRYSMWDIGVWFVGIPLSIICSMLIIGGAEKAISHFINPQYYAIQFFIDLVK